MAQRQCPQTPRRKSLTGLNPETGVATALTRHLLFLCALSTFVASFDWDTLSRLCGSEPESRLVERRNHYCLHSTVASASFLTCFTDLWIILYYRSLEIWLWSPNNNKCTTIFIWLFGQPCRYVCTINSFIDPKRSWNLWNEIQSFCCVINYPLWISCILIKIYYCGRQKTWTPGAWWVIKWKIKSSAFF